MRVTNQAAFILGQAKLTRFSSFLFLLLLPLGLLLFTVGLAGCGTAPVTGVDTNSQISGQSPPTPSQIQSQSSSSPETVADAVVANLKAAPQPANSNPPPNLTGTNTSGGVPVALSQQVRSRGSSFGNLFATSEYGPLTSYSPWQRLATPGLNTNEYVVLESIFEYQLTNGVARLGFSKKVNGDWQLVEYNLDFDPPGVVSRSEMRFGQDGLSQYQPKGFLEAVNRETRERLDKGLTTVYGVDTGFIAVGNIREHWRSSAKPFALSFVPSVEGRSTQWLAHFDGRNRQAQPIMGTIRLLGGQPWGLFVGGYSSGGSPQKPQLGFTLGSMQEDSTNICAKISYKPRCASLEYNKTGWGIALVSY